MRVETLEGVTPDSQWYSEEKRKYDDKEAARRTLPLRVISDGGQPKHALFELLRRECPSPKGLVQILDIPSSVFQIPLRPDKGAQVRAVGSLVNLLIGEYVQYILYPRKRTSVKYEWTHTFEHIFKALEVDDEQNDPCPLLVLMITSFRGPQYTPEPLQDPQHLELVRRMFTFWCNDHLKDNAALFYELIHWAAATRKQVILKTDYAPNGTFGDMLDVIRYFVSEKRSGGKIFPFPCKTYTYIDLTRNECSKELENTCSSDPLDNVARVNSPVAFL